MGAGARMWRCPNFQAGAAAEPVDLLPLPTAAQCGSSFAMGREQSLPSGSTGRSPQAGPPSAWIRVTHRKVCTWRESVYRQTCADTQIGRRARSRSLNSFIWAGWGTLCWANGSYFGYIEGLVQKSEKNCIFLLQRFSLRSLS